jgi:hypothetical protein
MTKGNKPISFDHAKKIAGCAILKHLYYAGLKPVKWAVLEDAYIESGSGWFFWGKKENFVSLKQEAVDVCFACNVSKEGECGQIESFHGTEDMVDYIETRYGSSQDWREILIPKEIKYVLRKDRKFVPITLEHAQKMAEYPILFNICRSILQTNDMEKLLEDDYLEAEYCWIFLRNKNIVVPPQDWFENDYGAYAISKKGDSSHIMHFPDEPERLKAYLQVMSDHFKKNGT